VTIEARCEAGHPVTSDEVAVRAAGPFGLDSPHPPG
jgi:hypothetical protein